MPKTEKKVQVCNWTLDSTEYDDHYETECGNAFIMTEGTPKENEMKFCCYCGKKLVEVPHAKG